MTSYYTLFIREDGRWAPQFGDYKRAVVAQEERDSYSAYPRKDRKIIESDATQRSITLAEQLLNGDVKL